MFLSLNVLASRAGDAALDERDCALRAESDRGSALMSATVPGRSRSSSLVPLVKGRAWRHRLLRAPGMCKRFSLPTEPQDSPGMLDELSALFPSSCVRVQTMFQDCFGS